MSTKNKIIGPVIALGLVLIGIFSFGLYPKNTSQPIKTSSQIPTQETSGVKVISTNPNPLENSVISPTQNIELSFNKPMVQDNSRLIIEPKASYNTQLSSDHKTLKIIPSKSFDLGKDYTLTIKSGYGSDTGEKTDSDIIFHFKTISYNGV